MHGRDDLRLDEIEEPAPGATDVVVRVAACGICGSDLSYLRTGGVSAPVVDPIGLGHELSGTIAAIGQDVRGLAPGMRVIVNPMGGGSTLTYGYHRVITERAAAFRAINAEYVAAEAAKDAGATRFCMAAAWRNPKDHDLEKVCDMVTAVKGLGMETCVTLGMLTPVEFEARHEPTTAA